jgi:septum formation protein
MSRMRMPGMPDFIYLASASPRRVPNCWTSWACVHRPLLPGPEEDAEALEAERAVKAAAGLRAAASRCAKLQAARRRLRKRRLPPAPILVADTTVALGRRILAKPADAEHAAAMLRALSGRTHRVFTAVAVRPGAAHRTGAERFARARRTAECCTSIAAYIRSGEPFGKAGAYGIQGRIAAWMQRIDGSYTGIMGLPLFETAALLKRAGFPLNR